MATATSILDYTHKASNDADTIICGDCVDVMRELPAACVNLIFTSPPYFNQRTYTDADFEGKKSGVSAAKSSITRDHYFKFIDEVLWQCYRVLKDGGVIAWNVGESREFDLKSHSSVHIEQAGFHYQDTIEWVKRGCSGLRVKLISSSHLYYPSFCHEPIYVYRKGDHMMNRMELEDSQIMRGWQITNVWPIKSVQSISEEGHPAPFPLELASMVIRCYSKRGDMVLDPFVGSGTTCVAAKQLGRHYMGIEINPQYCDDARARMAAQPMPLSAWFESAGDNNRT